jgi:hypothetical protein
VQDVLLLEGFKGYTENNPDIGLSENNADILLAKNNSKIDPSIDGKYVCLLCLF